MKNARVYTKGFTLIASLLMLLLLSGIAIGLMMMVNTEGKVGGTDLQNDMAFHAAEGGIEKMYSDLSAVFQNAQAPLASQICNVAATTNQPSMVGVTWTQYSVTPAGMTCPPPSPNSAPTSTPGVITAGPNAGLFAQVIPVNMLATASLPGGQEVSMVRQAQVALIPVFQFGMFCDTDCSIFPGAGMTFAGPVHANGDFYPFAGAGNIYFQGKVSVFGNIVRTELPNTNTASGESGPVYVPTSNNANACSTSTTNCTALAAVGTDYGDGSVTGGGSSTGQPAANISSYWNNFSNNTTHDMFINGNYYVTGATTPAGTGAKKLSLPFVGGNVQPYEILRLPPSGELATSAVGSSREYNIAQIHVLLSDNPAELPGGASDSNNVRLANVAQTGNTTVTAYGVTMASGNYVAGTFGTPSSGNTYNLYFATASNSVPIPANCSLTAAPFTCPSDDWALAPVQWTSTLASAAGVAYDPLVPAPTGTTPGAPVNWLNGPAPTVNLCPPTGVTATSTPAPSFNCATSTSTPTPTATSSNNTWTSAYPYYAIPNPSYSTVTSATTNNNEPYSDSWNLIDGWLRVEYEDSSGNWHPVTNEWLALGFARGVTAPTANGAGSPAGGTPNPINPNAILLFQEAADRSTTSTLAALCTSTSCPAGSLTALSTGISATPTATGPACTTWNTGHTICTAWTPGVPPQLAADTLALATPGTSATTGAAGDWAFGLTPTTPTSTTPQSITMYNWYPINFYDAREGEPRDIDWSTTSLGTADNSCTTNGVMNAVEIDVGNLKRWLAGSIGVNPATGTSSGTLVNSSTQNGYVLYFSDRRGMLPNPNLTSTHPANTKSGDSGLEDTVNRASNAGTPDGVKEAPMAGQTLSSEDDNENGVLDNWGAYNLGLGFYGTVANPSAVAANSLNTKIASTNPAPNPYGTVAANGGDRINSCGRTARKNWVSGARHVLKLVDGSLGNVPLSPTPIVYNGVTYNGGFTVASENPVYIQGNYNSNSTDTTWNATPTDATGHAAAAVIADAVTLFSNAWDDRLSMLGTTSNSSPTHFANRIPVATYYRMAVSAGKNMTFTFPTAGWQSTRNDIGTDGGIQNFLRLLEDWNPSSGQLPLYYKGSMASLYYSTYNTGFYKCCVAIYYVPTRDFVFDTDFSVPAGLPPGTPLFRDVESLSYRQLFTKRQASQ